jgi:hypothetical protein
MSQSYVSVLCPLVASPEQEHQVQAFLPAVDAVARSAIDAQLKQAGTYRAPVSTVAEGQTENACDDPLPRLRVPQSIQPFAERASTVVGLILANVHFVAYQLRFFEVSAVAAPAQRL